MFQSREKAARSTNVTTKTVGEATTSSNSKGWKSYEWLKQHLGERKLQAWIDKGMKARPEPMAGPTDQEMQGLLV